MNNDKFINVYIEILQKTLNDWLLQNVSLQANSKVSEEVIEEQAENIQNLNGKIEELTNMVNNLQQNKQNETDSQLKSYKDKVENLENAIKDHLNTIANLNTLKGEYENVKHQVQHIDTFRNDLIKAREEIKNLQIGHDKTRVLTQIPILQAGNHAPLAAPGLGSIAKLKDRPLLDWGVLVLSG